MVRTRAGPILAGLDTEDRAGAETVPEVQESVLEQAQAKTCQTWNKNVGANDDKPP
jgi:hypothetical protein